MISLKKYIESNREELLGAAMDAYRSALEAMAQGGVQACPPVGAQLQENLSNLQQHLSAEATPDLVQRTGEQAHIEIQQWGERAAGYFKQRAGEVKEILLIMARTADSIGERDQRYEGQLNQLTQRLESVADLHDLTGIRESLLRSAGELKACVDQMAQESRLAVTELRGELHTRQAQLVEAERLASVDALTGLDNRRSIETMIELRISQGRPFSIMLFDLDGFKRINDAHGHSAGDEVLKDFATELRAAFRTTDSVGRWGGDEFVAVLEARLDQANTQLERVRQWAFGSYTIQLKGKPCPVDVSAAAGVAEWRRGESAADLIARADASMYRQKGVTSSRS